MSIPLHRLLGRLAGAALLALCSTSACWADDGYDLYLYAEETGDYTCLDIANLRSLAFEQTREYNADSVRIYVNYVHANFNDGTSQSYDLAGYDAILFSTGGLDTGIDDVTEGSVLAATPFSLSGRQLTANANGALRIFSIDGRAVSQASVQAGQSLSLDGLPAGIYIINLGSQAAKIVVK